MQRHAEFGFPADLGDRGVDLFFVISGFCLARPYLARAVSRGRLEIDLGRFLIRRISRIVPPYAVAVVLFTLLGATAFGYPSVGYPYSFATALREIPFDLFFLTSREPAIDASFWTLGIEMRWYAMCPPLVARFVRSRVGFACAAIASFVAYRALHTIAYDFNVLPTFMLGIVAAAASLHRASERIARTAAFAFPLALALAVMQQRHLGYTDHGDPLFATTALLFVLAGCAPGVRAVLASPPLLALGRASFSIYLVHQPVSNALGFAGVPWPLAVMGGVLAGFLFWRLVEVPSTSARARARIERVLVGAGAALRQRPVVFRVATVSDASGAGVGRSQRYIL